jgi:phosphatidylglycerol:prolipoprotein diacylglycerol transferase
LLIGGWLWWRGSKPHGVGSIVGQYLALTGTARFLVEFIRRNPKIVWGLSNAQVASAGALVVGIALTAWAAARPAFTSQKATAPAEKPA